VATIWKVVQDKGGFMIQLYELSSSETGLIYLVFPRVMLRMSTRFCGTYTKKWNDAENIIIASAQELHAN